jgi:hypothetical protein
MRRKNNTSKTPDQIEALIQQAASYEPETEAPDDLVARAMASLPADVPAPRSSARNTLFAYGACGAAAIVGMGYLTAVMIGRGNASNLPDEFGVFKPSYTGSGGLGGMQTANVEQPVGIQEQSQEEQVSPRMSERPAVKSQPDAGASTPEAPKRGRNEAGRQFVPRVPLHTETVELVTEGLSDPAFLQGQGSDGETMMTPVMVNTMRSAEKPASQDNEDGGVPQLDTK